MGNFISTNNSENVNQTQISQINQVCNQTAVANINDINITAIDSHLGDITLSSTLTVGNLTCVMDAVSSQATQAITVNNTENDISQLVMPFQFDINAEDTTNTTIITSFQQSVINQSCIQRAAAEATDITLTFIDSSTGNIKISSQAEISSFACNLKASSYQSAVASVTDDTKNTISTGCCAFNAGMLIAVVAGIIGLVVVSRLANKKSPGSQGSGPTTDLDVLKAAAGAGAFNRPLPTPGPGYRRGTDSSFQGTEMTTISRPPRSAMTIIPGE